MLASHFLRRLVSVSACVTLSLVMLALAPACVPLLFLIDAGRQHKSTFLRFYCMFSVYLLCELLGVATAALIALTRFHKNYFQYNFTLQGVWSRVLFTTLCRLFRLQVQINGASELNNAPYVLLLRHISFADTLLPAVCATSRYNIHLRYILKQELLWDPCLDIVGQRLQNVFVRRGAGDTSQDLRNITELATHLGPREGVTIFPEGSRFTPQKRAALIAKLQARGESQRVQTAVRLRFTLPPRTAGAFALKQAAPHTDFIICAHTGFEGVRSFADLVNGKLLGRKIRVQFWRVAHQNVPTVSDDFAAWLNQQWQQVDDFVARHQQEDTLN